MTDITIARGIQYTIDPDAIETITDQDEHSASGTYLKTVINAMVFDGSTTDPIQKAVRDAMIAFTSPYFWYTTRATGLVALVLFTIVVCLGTFISNRVGCSCTSVLTFTRWRIFSARIFVCRAVCFTR